MEKARHKPDGTRQRIMDTARQLFVQRGYFNTSIPDIVRASEVSIGSIYHHFENKQELAKELYEETMRSFVETMHRQTAELTGTEAKLKALVRYLYALCEDDSLRMEYMLFMRHAEIYPDHVPICLSEPFAAVTAWIRDGIAIGEVRAGSEDLAAGIFMGGILKVVELRLRGVLKKSLPDCLEETFSLAWSAIRK
ncbi:TetR/AcrR family transcriptional regulator [Paradesulfitobacterium ferrireducens]|uniref:TetR/AcrR family transcriptional regulator n=1 Tax=Paradesulfitobacterium ferrireducens TaxID=2816476 RepID=UPI001A8F9866|nr:TetR/AcrR family transcriptional regulator [Paradesulfitobacterium ferrireducens]